MGAPKNFNHLQGLQQANPLLNLNHIGWGNQQDMLVPGLVGRPKKRLSRFEEARLSLMVVHPDMGGALWHYDQVAAEDAIQALGWWNPMHGGRPKLFAQMMLSGIPSPVSGKGYPWKVCGLMYFTAYITGRRRSKNRTTTTGLALLRHWADMYPRFRPFLDAYWSAKAERQITLECVDLALGIMPPAFQKAKQMDVQAQIKLAEARKRQAQMDQIAKVQMAMTNVAAQGYQNAHNALNVYQNQLLQSDAQLQAEYLQQKGLFGSIFGPKGRDVDIV